MTDILGYKSKSKAAILSMDYLQSEKGVESVIS